MTEALRLSSNRLSVSDHSQADHPVWNAEARRAFAEDARERLFGKCDELRAAGRWSTEMEEAWTALADSEEEDPEVGERLSALARLVNRATE
jgi:hypothetical protein